MWPGCLFSVASNAETREPLKLAGKNSASVGKIDACNMMSAEHTTLSTLNCDLDWEEKTLSLFNDLDTN